MIGFAALLSVCIENKILAALFFSIGLLYIRISKFYLFTGQVQNLRLRRTTIGALFGGLCGNLVGVGLAFFLALAFFSSRPQYFEVYDTIQAAKWSYPWYSYLYSGFCCGILMTIATKKDTPFWITSLCVMAFILAGFNHCIADWFYIGGAPINLLYWLLIVVGNFLGGYIAATEDKI